MGVKKKKKSRSATTADLPDGPPPGESIDNDAILQLLRPLVEEKPQQKNEHSKQPITDANDLANLTERTNSLSINDQPRKPNRHKARLQRREEELERRRETARKEIENLTDQREEELSNMKQIISDLGLCEKEITGNGHCLFAAIADQLHERKHIRLSITALRRIAAEFIRENASEFELFLLDEDTQKVTSIAKYTDRLENTAEWGGEVELQAIARALDLRIALVNGEGILVIPNGTKSNADLFLSFYRHQYDLGAHYNSLHNDSLSHHE